MRPEALGNVALDLSQPPRVIEEDIFRHGSGQCEYAVSELRGELV